MITVDTKDVRILAARIAGMGKQADLAIQIAINFGIRRARTMISRAIRSQYAITDSAIKDTMKEQWASPGKLIGGILVSSKDIPLSQFRPNLNKTKPISVMILKGNRVPVPRAFGRNGMILQRKGDAREPLKFAATRGAAGMLRAHKVIDVAEPEVQKLVTNELTRQINRLLS